MTYLQEGIFEKKESCAPSRAVLLINLGTPDSPSRRSVRAFLQELLLDANLTPNKLKNRNFDNADGVRFESEKTAPLLTVGGVFSDSKMPPSATSKTDSSTCLGLLPLSCLRRYMIAYIASFLHMNESVRRYRAIWTQRGSPLLMHSIELANGLQKMLHKYASVFLAMRYGNPSIRSTLQQIEPLHIDELCIIPCFPLNAPPITSSILEALSPIQKWSHIPKLTFLPAFSDQSWFVKPSAATLVDRHPEEHDHVVYSFHALPEKHTEYVDQCMNLAREISREAGIPNFSVGFQSKMGRGKWSQPTTSETLTRLCRQGKKKILISTPGFLVDCVETLWEVGIHYRDQFLQNGGLCLTRASCLNDSPQLLEGLSSLIYPNKL